jgi:hypothetical protein
LLVIGNEYDDCIGQRTVARLLGDTDPFFFEFFEHGEVLIADRQIEASAFDAARHTRAHIAGADQRHSCNCHDKSPKYFVSSALSSRSSGAQLFDYLKTIAKIVAYFCFTPLADASRLLDVSPLGGRVSCSLNL